MALDFFTGFDYYTNTEVPGNGWVAAPGAGGITTAQFRNGTRSCLIQSGTSLSKTDLSNNVTRILGMAVRPDAFSNNGNTYGIWASLGDGNPLAAATTQVSLGFKNTGALVVFKGVAPGTITNSTTGLLGTSTNLLSIGVWVYIELVVTISSSVGTIEVYVNGTKTGWIDLSGQNNQNTGAAQINSIGFTGSTGLGAYIDDLVVISGSGGTTTTRIGDVVVKAVNASTGNGTFADSTPSTGSDRGAMVDETVPNSDTDYNSFAAAGNKDTYNFPALGLTGTVVGLQVKNFTRKTDPGSGTDKAIAYLSSVVYEGTELAMGQTYAYAWGSMLWENSPATNAPWTVTEIDNGEFGLKRVT